MPNRFVVVTITRETDPARQFQFKYPAAYSADEIERAKKGPLVYAGQMTQGDADQEEMLMCISRDEVMNRLLADPSRSCRVLTRTEAQAWLAAAPSLNGISDEQVTDPNRLLLISVKLQAGMPLTQDDRDCLNPDHPKQGVRRSPARTVQGIFKA